ncbi:hypothetical protein P5673_017405 [Acropora cervicornis]|uniref:Uncharacterized protein n=1 Tax=Acropora cervicornis TaxID=6130 RepID=A0AAD9V3F4_ACRCE|nr:hypothetical protein P5673_017405 [Acropora cervicornis]
MPLHKEINVLERAFSASYLIIAYRSVLGSLLPALSNHRYLAFAILQIEAQTSTTRERGWKEEYLICCLCLLLAELLYRRSAPHGKCSPVALSVKILPNLTQFPPPSTTRLVSAILQ